MLTLYSVPVSLYCAKVRIALRHKGLTWQEEPPAGGYGSAEYKRLVPSGNLPALDHDGLVIGDSETINEYLQDRWPDPPMLPDTAAARARTRDLSRFHDTRLEPELRGLFGQITPALRNPETIAARAAGLSARLAQGAQLLAEREATDPDWTLSLGDCGYPVTAKWIEAIDDLLGVGVIWPDGMRDYLARLDAIPAVREELEQYSPVIPEWLAMKMAA